MNFLKLWYFICILLFYYYASQILELRNKVSFKHQFRATKKGDVPITTFCIDLNLRSTRCLDLPVKLKFNCSRPAYSFGCLTKDFHLLTIKEMDKKLGKCSLTLKNTQYDTPIMKKYFYNGHYCLVLRDSKFNRNLKFVDDYLKFFESTIGHYEAKIFFGERTNKFMIPVDFSRHSFIRRCITKNNLIKCRGLSIFLEKIVVKTLEHPYETDCRASDLSREQCFLECNKNETRKLNLNHYRLLYETDENVYLNISELIDDAYDDQLFPNFTICNERCSKKDCTEYFFEIRDAGVIDFDSLNFHLLNKVRIIEAVPLVSSEYILIYLLGLFGNLFNVTLIKSVENLVLNIRAMINFFLVSKINLRNAKALRKQNLFWKFIIYLAFAIGTIVCVTELFKLFKAYFEYNYIQSDYTENPIENERITVTICMLIYHYLSKGNRYLLLLKKDSGVNKYQSIENFYSTYTLEEITNLTQNFADIHVESFLKRGDLKEEIIATFGKLFFYNKQKCFQVHVNFQESRIHYKILKLTVYNILLNTNYHTYYITPFKQIQNHKDHPFNARSSFAYFSMKKNLKYPFSDNCKEYKYVNKLEHIKCHNRMECIEQCVQYQFIQNSSIVVDNYFIDLSLYPIYLRQKLKIMSITQESNDFKVLDYFFKKCSKKFHRKSCKLLKYEELVLSKNKNAKQISINLYMLKRTNRKSRAIKEMNILYESVSIVGIWFSLSLPVLIRRFFKSIFKIFKKRQYVKWSAIKLTLNLLFILIFSYKVKNLIYNGLLSNKFNLNANSMVVDELQMPKISVCFQYNLNFSKDPNLKDRLFTGIELNAITLNISKIIESIEYLDKDSKKVILDNERLKEYDDLEKVNKIKFKDILIFIIYFQQLKCYEMIFQHPFHFKFMPNFFVSNLFKMTFVKKHPPITLILSVKNDLNINQRLILSDNKLLILYFNKMTTEVFDHFYYFRNPSALMTDRGLNSDDNLFYESIRKNFANFNGFSTTLIPLTKEYFHLIINNSAFDSFYHAFYDNRKKIERLKMKIYQSFQVKRSSEAHDRTALILRPTRYESFLVYVNEFSYSELFFYLSSEFNIWLGITVIDMPSNLINAYCNIKNFLAQFFSLVFNFLIGSISNASKIVIRSFKWH